MYEYQRMRIWREVLQPAIDAEKLELCEAIAIVRCLVFSDQIADVSIGNMFRQDVENLLQESAV